jgi:hypothetical protein
MDRLRRKSVNREGSSVKDGPRWDTKGEPKVAPIQFNRVVENVAERVIGLAFDVDAGIEI